MTQRKKNLINCDVCNQATPYQVIYELRCGHIILLEKVCLSCMFVYSETFK